MLPNFIIDFDSTFVTVEGLDELANISLKNHPQKEKITQEIANITKEGMEGIIDFPTSLSKRLALFKPTNDDIVGVIELLNNHITPSVIRNKKFSKTTMTIFILFPEVLKNIFCP